jgi:ATP-dependent RNA helicase RhlE
LSTFSQFALGESLLRAVAQAGHDAPTPIQIRAIPPVLAGRDLCGIAQTGTGKTAAFALPILERLSAQSAARVPSSPRVLVLTPTRELASQVAQSFRTYSAGKKFSIATVFGGVSQRPQVEALRRGVDVLVATPGRLLDLIQQRLLTLARVEIFVVDEADQMLDLGFIVPLRKIVKLVPVKRQTLFFSATMPKTIAELANSILSDPVRVEVAPAATTVERVNQSVMFVPTVQKQALLERVLSDPAMQRVLVFTRTKHGADKVVRNLARAGIEAAAIHGNKAQAQRERALAAFKNGAVRVLVATDIAARGIHVESVTHVVNFDLPHVPESYVHRIGRTARAGAAGIAISFCNGEERALLKAIEKLTRVQVSVAALPAGMTAAAEGIAERKPGRRPERRPDGRHTPRQKQGSGVGKPERKRAGGRDRKNETRPRRGGLDSATGLPAFLSRPTRPEPRDADRGRG